MKNNSAAQKMKFYSLEIVMLCIMMFLAAFAALYTYSRGYNDLVDSNQWLQMFYSHVEQMQELSENYRFLGRESDLNAYQQEKEQALENLAKLKELGMEGNYRRNIMDLETLFQKYLKSQENNLQKKLEEKNNAMDNQNELLESMRRKKNVLSSEIYRYFAEYQIKIENILKKLAIVLITLIAVSILLIRFGTEKLMKDILNPLEVISDKARQIQTYRFDAAGVSGEGSQPEDIMLTDLAEQNEDVPDEIAVLQSALYRMLLRIHDQVLKLKTAVQIQEKLKEQEMENLRVSHLLTMSELKCLQMQVNPHFLFNTLNMIQQTVFLGKKEKTSFLLKETANFLRYSLDYSGKTVTLQKELEALGCYVSLQEERLGNRVLFEFELDESVSGMKVPSLILQPLVENSLIHGVGDFRNGALIMLRTFYDNEEQCGVIVVEDNGHGLSAEKLEELRGKMQQLDLLPDKSIGLENVYKRLLLNDRRIIMKVESEEEKGMSVEIRIPYVRGVENL